MTNPTHILIGIAGHKGSGKSTVAAMLAKHLPGTKTEGVRIMHFAEPIKQLVAEQFKIPRAHLESVKNNPIVRQTLQRVGSDGRLRDPAIWINILATDYIKARISCSTIIIDDVRHLNEAFWLRREGGILLHIYCKSVDSVADYHESEANVRYLGGDFDIHNDGTAEALHESVEKFIRKFKLWENR